MKHLKRINENSKMPSIFQEIKGYEVDVSDLASFIADKYGKSPEIEASLEMGDDDTKEIFADAKFIHIHRGVVVIGDEGGSGGKVVEDGSSYPKFREWFPD